MSNEEPTYNEKQLLLRVVQGDETAYRILFDAYWDKIYHNILRMCKSPELAEDLAQEVFIRIWLNREKLSELRQFDAFLYKVSKHLVVDALRKKILPSLKDDFFSVYFAADALNALELMEKKEIEKTVRQAVEKLPPQMQRVFVLHRFNGLSHEQIAKEMNISRVSSQTYMARAIVQLRAILNEHGSELAFLSLILLVQ